MLSKKRYANKILLFSFFIHPLSTLLTPFVNPHIMAWIVLLVFFFLFFIVFLKNNFILKKSFIYFYILYFSALIVDFLLYPKAIKYSLAEAIVFYSLFLYMIYIVSSGLFSEYIFLMNLKKYSIFSLIIATIILLFYKKFPMIMSYGSISGALILPILFIAINNIINKKINILVMLITLLLSLFGSRMPLLAGILTILFSYLYRFKKSKKNKFIFLFISTVMIFFICIIYLYRIEIIGLAIKLLSNFNINLRSLEKIYLNFLEKSSIIDMFLSSGRGEVYTLTIEWIKTSSGLPGLFGIIRYYSQNKFNYPHFIFLDIIVFFGYILVFPSLCYFYFKKKKLKITNELKAIITIFSFNFFIRSLTGAHFIGDLYSNFIIAIVIFYPQKYKKGECKIEKNRN